MPPLPGSAGFPASMAVLPGIRAWGECRAAVVGQDVEEWVKAGDVVGKVAANRTVGHVLDQVVALGVQGSEAVRPRWGSAVSGNDSVFEVNRAAAVEDAAAVAGDPRITADGDVVEVQRAGGGVFYAAGPAGYRVTADGAVGQGQRAIVLDAAAPVPAPPVPSLMVKPLISTVLPALIRNTRLALLPLIAKLPAPGPVMVRSSLMVSAPLVRVMVPATLKVIVSAPTAAFASAIAWRS